MKPFGGYINKYGGKYSINYNLINKNYYCTSVNNNNNEKIKIENVGESVKITKTGRNDDGDNNDDEIIYYGKLTPQIKGLKVFTCCSSLGGIFVQAIIIQNILTGENLSLNLGLGSAVGFFTFVTPFLIHSLTKKYVTEIKYNSLKKTYEAITLPIFTTMCIKGKPVFVVSESFLDINHYIKMMGYDKPIDLKLNIPNNNNNNNDNNKLENDEGLQR
ncbi:conserved hypothetical protein [Pediculus humanus corporis]|uniref:Transmembrane protein n=1 Tax=Pediculus humanus subsp. corporis TaxID=121224 RepID=E0W1Y4_PEDHC|nr:uncharacterized protein Phum_PHUM580670 [Pediculus humanus corporis]EEB19578.1 conserved hypothetical protein [Pediculus humanus corporis]